MNRRTSQGQASRSIFGRSRVTHRDAPGTLSSGRTRIVARRSAIQRSIPPSMIDTG
jgi:hypothetical protein